MKTEEPHYVFEHGMYFYYAGDEWSKVHTGILNICMVYDPDTFTMIKHGSKTLCQTAVDDYRSNGFSVNLLEISQDCPVDEINKCITTSGYIKYLLGDNNAKKE